MVTKSQSYKDLIAWQKGIELTAWIYELTKKFPREEVYGIVNQMRRAAVSVPSNIAEGQSRQHKAEFIQFLHIAKGSLSELETQLTISSKLDYVSKDEYQAGLSRIDEVSKLLFALIRKLKTENCKLVSCG